MLWRIKLFGKLRAETDGPPPGDGRLIERFPTQKTALLLAYLACHPDRVSLRDTLIQALWPEGDPKPARHRLSVALSYLRGELEGSLPGAPPVLLADRLSVRLCPDLVTTDLAEFEAALGAAEQAEAHPDQLHWLEEAVGLYEGELLTGYYEPWILSRRAWLAERFFRASIQLIGLLEESGEVARALEHARRGVEIDPLREDMRRELMRLLAADGNDAAALLVYRELHLLLHRELQAEPEPETRALFEKLESGARESASLDASCAPARSLRPSVPSPVRGALTPESPFYIQRPADDELHAAIRRRDGVVLLKGSRQVGKTSLLAQGLEEARRAGVRIVQADLQLLNGSHLESVETLYQSLAGWLAEQLQLEVFLDQVWSPRRGPSGNFTWYLQHEVLEKIPEPIVWALDETDVLVRCEFVGEVFGLFRALHNQRALEPAGPWDRLVLVLVHAAEPYLFIQNIHQSPFNVGTLILLRDFQIEETAELNRRYGSPLRDAGEVAQFTGLVGGHPYLVHRGIQEMATHALSLSSFSAQAHQDRGVYGDHLQRILALLGRDRALGEEVREVMQGRPCRDVAAFHRLRSAGILSGETPQEARLRTPLYRTYLERSLR